MVKAGALYMRLCTFFRHTWTALLNWYSLSGGPWILMVIRSLRCFSFILLRFCDLMWFCTLNPCSQSAVWYGIMSANSANLIKLGRASLWWMKSSLKSFCVESRGYIWDSTVCFAKLHSILLTTSSISLGLVTTVLSYDLAVASWA